MTKVYFIRHAEPNFNNHDDRTRELTAKGLEDSRLVTKFLTDKHITVIYSSPYKRAMDTIRDFADSKSLEIKTMEDFRERKVGNGWIDDFMTFCKKQWSDFDYKLIAGESLREVQDRNIAALNGILNQYEDKNIVIGSHGTALSTIINFYDKTYGYLDFMNMIDLMPWVVQFTFEGHACKHIDTYNLFDIYTR